MDYYFFNARKLEKSSCPNHLPDFNLESSLLLKIYLLWKNLTDFHKTVETGVDLHLSEPGQPWEQQKQENKKATG